MLYIKHLCRFTNPAVDLVLRNLSQLKSERHIFINRHMRVECIALENHCNIPVLGRNIVDYSVSDFQLSFCYILKTCYHSQRCGLSAARRTDENNKLPV